MFRYITLAWNPLEPATSSAVNALIAKLAERLPLYQRCFAARGLCVLCAEAGTPGLKVHRLGDNSGVLLGSVFKRHRDILDDAADQDALPPDTTLDAAAAERLVSTRGRSLFTDYWGDYVAFLLDPAPDTKRVMKDPTGTLSCFSTSWRRVDIVFSCLGDLIELRMFSFTVNRSYLESMVAGGGYDFLSSPLNEVSEIHRGECLTIVSNVNARRTRELYWNPMTFAEPSSALDDAPAAARALRAAVLSATHTLARGHDGILLRLSGGLDSSIISGSLKGAHKRLKVTSYTYFVSRGRSDERRWARLAADHAGSEHLEFSHDPANCPLSSLSFVKPTVTPAWAYSYLLCGEMERKVAQTHPYTAIFCGDGGDSGFGGECISLAVDDLLRLKGLVTGLGSGMIRLASQVALRTDSLTWSVLRKALRRRRVGSSMHDYREKLLVGAALANRTVRAAALHSAHYPHPWFAACDHVPWHVIGRLGNLLSTPESNDPFLSPDAISPYIAAPLYSQPVVELCLRIPLYTHFHLGHERGLARMAFQKEVPLPILRRQWKDRAPGAFEDLVSRNRAYLSETLLGGVLYRDGFLDRDATQNALSGAICTHQFQAGEILNYLHLENWLRHFEGRSAATA